MKSKSIIVILVVGLVVVGAAFGYRTFATRPLDGIWVGGIAYFDHVNNGGWKYYGSGDELAIKLNANGTFEDPNSFQEGKWTQEGNRVLMTVDKFNRRTKAEDKA